MLGTILPDVSRRFSLSLRQNGTIAFVQPLGIASLADLRLIGLAVSSRIIGAIAAGDATRLRKALLVLPSFAVIMVGLNLAIRTSMR